MDFWVLLTEYLFSPLLQSLFVYYNELQAEISININHYYYSNENFHNLFNLLKFIAYKTHGYFLDYKIEPIEENWINSVTFYLNDDKYAILNECYDTIYFDTNEKLVMDTIKNKLEKFDRLQLKDLNSIKYLYYTKLRNKYFCKLDPIKFSTIDLESKFVSNPFMEILYKDLNNDEITEIELDKSYFIQNNDILSMVFLKRYFDYKPMPQNFIFNQNYELLVTNFNFEDIIIKNNQYVHLEDNNYTIENV